MNQKSLSILSYNIDGREYNFEERLRYLLNEITNADVDIILIQEGNRLTFEKLLRNLSKEGYHSYFPKDSRGDPFGEMIFSKYKIQDSGYLNFKQSNKVLSYVSIFYEEQKVWIFTSQFDNLVISRKEQLKTFSQLAESVSGKDILVFGGDTKIESWQSIFDDFLSDWNDCWETAGNKKNFYTVNRKKNILSNTKGRPDRILYKSHSNFRCIGFDLLGIESSISSHFGVMGTFSL